MIALVGKLCICVSFIHQPPQDGTLRPRTPPQEEKQLESHELTSESSPETSDSLV